MWWPFNFIFFYMACKKNGKIPNWYDKKKLSLSWNWIGILQKNKYHWVGMELGYHKKMNDIDLGMEVVWKAKKKKIGKEMNPTNNKMAMSWNGSGRQINFIWVNNQVKRKKGIELGWKNFANQW